jgi:hypothetical protein
MKKLLQFVSLTILTQAVVALNQIVLLPIQIRIWGHASTAYWYTTLALASVTSLADFGLHTAGHAELIRYARNLGDKQAKAEFQHLWAWIRILICMVTLPLIAVDLIYGGYRFWHTALIIGMALESLLTIRMTYLDSLELYRQSEAGYLLLATARLSLSIVALVFFHSSPELLAWIWCFAGMFAIAHQNRLCRRTGLLHLFEPVPPGLSFRTLGIARHTMADPTSNWTRNSVPVLVLSAIAPPLAVTTYVALRTVFGASRQMIMQFSRYASVQYVSLRQAHKTEQAEVHFRLCIVFTTFFASVLTCIVIIDNFRLASLWLLRVDMTLYQAIAIAFGFASPFCAYQIIQALMLRYGKVREIARRQYFYVISLLIFAAIALVIKSLLLWLVLILMAEVTISLSFMLRASANTPSSAGVPGFLAALASALLSAGLWLIVRFSPLDFLRQSTTPAIAYTLAFSSLWILLIAAVSLYVAGLSFAEWENLGRFCARRSLALFNTHWQESAK